MSIYEVTLKSDVAKSFRCTKAANSLDIDAEKKSVHHLRIEGADIVSPFNVGLIVGASGSGKTTLAQQVYGVDCFRPLLDLSQPVIDQLPAELSYDECAGILAGVGLTSVPCWIRPAYTLSNGQRARAEAALQMAHLSEGVAVIDEWTSVVDRTVAKVMSHCIQKHARKAGRRVVLLSCHYDVIDWLDPDWVIDCNRQEFIDRRSVRRGRTESLTFDLREVDRASWRYFSKYHYLSETLPGGHIKTFGLFHGDEQIGFQCFANYVPHRKGDKSPMKMHSNRTVIHPDYAGLGLGIKVINASSMVMESMGYRVMAKYSSTPVYLSMKRYPCWQLLKVERNTSPMITGNIQRKSGYRLDVKTYSFEFHGSAYEPTTDGVLIRS